MKHNCEVVRDLLPLYHDGVCSKKSREMVEEHLTECEACKKELEEIKKEVSVPNASKKDAARACDAFRLADGRIYLEFNGMEHAITVVESPNDPSETGGQSYILRMGYSKATQDVKMTSPEFWGVINGNYEQVELDSAGKNDIIVICRMDDKLPSATEEMEKRAAEYDALMEHSVG